MTRATLIIILPVLLWVSACSESAVEPAVDAEWDVVEAAVRFEIEGIDTSLYDFFTLTQMTDAVPRDRAHAEYHAPPAWLVDRIHDAPLPYRAYDQCSTGIGGVLHADFEGSGWLVWTGSATITGSASAIVYAGYYFSGLGAKGELLQLKRESGKWGRGRAPAMWGSWRPRALRGEGARGTQGLRAIEAR